MHGLPDFRETLEVLDRNRVECILVGGVAAVLQGAPISTLDTDIVYRRTADNIERLVAAGGVNVLLLDVRAIIETKQQAGRNKDLLALPILRETLRLREAERDSP